MIDLKLNKTILEKHRDFIFGENKKKSNRLYKSLERAVKEARSEKVKKILKYLFDNLELIIVGNISKLDKIKVEFENQLEGLPTKKKKSRQKKELYKHLEIFTQEYKYFYYFKDWNAYEFQKELGITVCPYCNSQFIFIYESKKGRTRAVLDHFYDKGRFPFLAISIYNLVPCCKVCNSDFKGKKETSIHTHYSPYEKRVSEHIRFRKELVEKSSEVKFPIGVELDEEIDYVSVIIGYQNSYNIKLEPVNTTEKLAKKIEANIKMFHLEEIYNTYHKQHVQNIILKSYIYNYAYRQQLKNTYKVFFNNSHELRNALIPRVEEDKKTILGKLTREIIEDETKDFML
ncbi:hypothetical protein [Ornithinibacillus halotolerans]|uniref:HNH endonuclease n=1 Tax=Ornithinibacillus halotolerans TaxID=1274357 RepID=A0A916RQ74_9BACI|nr:hypothetical protein [Ornithinibacillus halotolerans]GGA65229.1 hypothetical protein GCM10008025_06360 [Ornithinibacillus halotolerans]